MYFMGSKHVMHLVPYQFLGEGVVGNCDLLIFFVNLDFAYNSISFLQSVNNINFSKRF